MTHIDHLIRHIPDLKNKRILDLGAGKGPFLIDAASRGFNAVGVEINEDYIKLANERARDAGVEISILKASGEKLPFPNDSFEFVNVAEVLEHVEDPDSVLFEIKRMLVTGGVAYLSIPNRFGLKDPHYHLYFINWLPRFLAEKIINFLKKQKDYGNKSAGKQKLSDMHYMTLREFKDKCRKHNLFFEDSRVDVLVKKTSLPRSIAIFIYAVISFFTISTFHGLAHKK